MLTRFVVLSAALASVVGVTEHRRAQTAPGDAPGSKATILEIVDSRALRLPEIDGLKGAGVIGENNRALVEIVDSEELDDPQAKAEVERLVKAENADRERLYAALVSSGDGGGDGDARLRALRERYAEIMRQDAGPGYWIQLPNGAWRRKGGKEE